MSNFDALVVGGLYLLGNSGKQVRTSIRSHNNLPELALRTRNLVGNISVSLNIKLKVCMISIMSLQRKEVLTFHGG